MKQAAFKDFVQIYIRAGNGGNGCISFRREKFIPRGGPDGGDGGDGGSVILRCDENEDSLLPLYYHPHQRARHAQHGMRSNCHGRNSDDCIVKTPPGTVVSDAETGQILGELLTSGEELVAAKGGKGGLGNLHFKTAVNRTPRQCTEGSRGEEKVLHLELKVIANVGLAGYPNAGKSTLLGRLTSAHPKIAPYPFTTLNPIIGTLEYENFRRLKIADIPGLIDGAHKGIGLGHRFLRHIERSRFILLVLDMAGIDGRRPIDDFLSLREELRLHSEALSRIPCLVIANKMDLPGSNEFLQEFKRRTRGTVRVIPASPNESMDTVKTLLYRHFFQSGKSGVPEKGKHD